MKKFVPAIFLFLTLISFSTKPAVAKSQCEPCKEQTTGQCSRGEIKCVKGSTICCCDQIPGGNSCSQIPGSVQATIPPNGVQTSTTAGQNPTCSIVGGGNGIDTAIGCIPYEITTEFVGWILGWAIGVGGGIAFLLIIYSSLMIMASQGNPEGLKSGQELLTSAISGLILLIFSIFILKLIGFDILKLSSFGWL